MRSAISCASSCSPAIANDRIGVPPLIDGLTFGGLIADKAFDSNAIVAELDQRGDQAAPCPWR